MTLKELRTQSGKTAKEVASELNVTERTIARYEQGIRRISLEQVLKLAEVYEVSEKEVIEAQLSSCQKALKDNRH